MKKNAVKEKESEVTQVKSDLKEAVKVAKERIREQIKRKGPYSHNIVGFTLSGFANTYGTEHANKLIRDLHLTRIFGIEEVDA